MVARSNDVHPSRDLTVAFPEGDLVRKARILGCRLDVSCGVDGPCSDGMLARLRIGPVERPERPGILGLLRAIQLGGLPRAIVNLHLHRADGRAPRRAVDAVGADTVD